MRWSILAFLLLLAACAPASNAQQAALEVSLAVTEPSAPISYSGTTDVPIEVTVGCAVILQAGGEAAVDFTYGDVPAWLNVEEPSLTAGPQPSCLLDMEGTVVLTGNLGLTPAFEAPGMNETTFTVMASVDTQGEPAESAPQDVTVMIEFRPNYTIATDITFPYNVTEDEVRFNVTVTMDANARSMVMFEEVSASEGSFTGLASQTYDAPPEVRVFPVVFTPPDGDWTQSNVTFRVFSHYLPLTGTAGDAMGTQNPVWVFTNGNPGGSGGDGGKGVPGVGPVFLIGGLLGLAVIVRRRA
jgi:hypothetical protein